MKHSFRKMVLANVGLLLALSAAPVMATTGTATPVVDVVQVSITEFESAVEREFARQRVESAARFRQELLAQIADNASLVARQNLDASIVTEWEPEMYRVADTAR